MSNTTICTAATAWEVSRMYEGLSDNGRSLIRDLFCQVNNGIQLGWIGVSVNVPLHKYDGDTIHIICDKLRWLGYNVTLDGDGAIEGFTHFYIDWNSSTQSRVRKYYN